MSSSSRLRGMAAGVTFVALLAPTTNAAADELSAPIDRVTVLRAAVGANPGIHASEQRAHAIDLAAGSAGRLPPPEVMLQVWQVPIEKPYALGDAGMIMVGLGQTFPSPGARGAVRTPLCAP